jgi:hypothetical protein
MLKISFQDHPVAYGYRVCVFDILHPELPFQSAVQCAAVIKPYPDPAAG